MIQEKLKTAIRIQADALQLLEGQVNQDLENIVLEIEKKSGKIVFVGVGKSGHIGTKLAATFSSLGISAVFVHATEAVHGDLGMIANNDIVILLSNSGNTVEVVAALNSLKKRNIKTIAITSNKDSILANKCDLKFVYEYENEADDKNLAPTTSTTILLVLGDAIAITLSSRLNFTEHDFLMYHPGGSLGNMLEGNGNNNA